MKPAPEEVTPEDNYDELNDKAVFNLTQDAKTITKISSSGEIATYTVYSEEKSFEEARAICHQEGGDLASIHNQAENKAISKLAK